MYIMLNLEKVVCVVVRGVNSRVPDILAVLNECWVIIQVALGIKVEIRYMVPQRQQTRLTSAATIRVWRPHVCWEVSQDIPKGHLIIYHLIFESRRIETR